MATQRICNYCFAAQFPHDRLLCSERAPDGSPCLCVACHQTAVVVSYAPQEPATAAKDAQVVQVIYLMPDGSLTDTDDCAWSACDTADEWPDWTGIDECECGAPLPDDCSGNCEACGYYLPDLVAHHCEACGEPISGEYYVCLDGGDTFCRHCVDVRHAVGICPSCGKLVDSEEPDGPVWTCPSDLSPWNKHWQAPAGTEDMYRAAHRDGFYGLCLDDMQIGIQRHTSGAYGCPYEHLPLHSKCYETGEY